MKLTLFKVALRAHEAECAQDRLKSEMRRVWRERVPLEEIAEACGMPVPRVASIVGADRPYVPPAAPTEPPAEQAP